MWVGWDIYKVISCAKFGHNPTSIFPGKKYLGLFNYNIVIRAMTRRKGIAVVEVSVQAKREKEKRFEYHTM